MAIKTYNDQNFVAIANAIRSKSKNPTTYKPSEMAAAISALETALEVLPQDTVSGAIANFPDGSDGYPVVELIANIAPKQAGSGDPAPSNVRPISGYTGMKVTKAGSNLISLGNVDFTHKGLRYYTQNNALYIDGTSVGETSSNDTIFKDNLYFYLPSGTYYFTRNNYPQAMYLRAEVNGVDTTIVTNAGSFTLTGFTKCWIAFYQYNRVYDNLLVNSYVSVGSAATAYEPYNYEEISISWESEAGTVYSGTLNVTTGELTVAYKYLSISEMSQEYPYAASGYFGGRLPVSDMKYNQRSNGYCETLKPISSPSGQNLNCVCFGANNSDIFIVMSTDLVGSTLASLNAYLSNNPVNVLYPLDTPEVYQLEPEEVKTLLGVNNIYADTGNVSLTYRADVDLYIAKKIAEGA